MSTPFDNVVDEIKKRGYHNHRKEEHSNTVSRRILSDLLSSCSDLREDYAHGIVKDWINVPAPGSRGRKIDLLVGEPQASDQNKPNLEKMRIGVENKSVVTAHRNRDARFDDLDRIATVAHNVNPEVVHVATVIVGVAERVLNIPDGVKKRYKRRKDEFEKTIVPRLSSGDQTLWTEFADDVSFNKPEDPSKTITKFRTLPQRPPALTNRIGYDFLLLAPMFIDNVNPPYVARQNTLGVDIDKEYTKMLDQICKAYRVRWHS